MVLKLLDREVKALAEKYSADSYSVEKKTHLKNEIYNYVTAWVGYGENLVVVVLNQGVDKDNYNEEYLLFALEQKIKEKLKK